MPSVEVQGARLRYEVSGQTRAPALLLLNSLGTSLESWDDQVAAFAQHYRVIRYDGRGHGQSQLIDDREAHTAELAADALAVLDAVQCSRAHWCGLSLGGMLAMWAAANHAERVMKLVVCNSSAHMPPPDAWQQRIELARSKGMEPFATLIPPRWFTPGFLANAPDRVQRIVAMLLATDPRGYAVACAAIRDMDQREQIKTIQKPTLVIGGLHDVATPPPHAELIQQSISQARLIMLNASHLSNVEQPEAFTHAVLEFLRG